jgi:hypothetical protein
VNIALYGLSKESGEFISYLRLLMDSIGKGYSVGGAHEQAVSSLTRLQGPVVVAFPQAVPALMPVELRDVFLGSTVYTGSVFDLPDRSAPRIVETSEDQTLHEGEAPTLVVLAEDQSPIDPSRLSVYGVITAPLNGGNPPEQVLVDLSYDAQVGRHRVTLAGFPTAQFGANAGPGQYAVGLYAKDPAGNLSTVNSLTITTPPTHIREWIQF